MIRRIALALAGLFLLGGAAPITRIISVPERNGFPLHSVRVRLWPGDGPGRHPFLIYQPGWNGSADENSLLLADLAAEGFTVAALDLNTPQPPDFAEDAQRLALPMDFSSFESLGRTIAEGDWRVVALSGDAIATLNRLPEAMTAPAIGILGYSFGGAVALQACRDDPRFAACVNMDGWMFGPAANHPSPQPTMVLSGDPYPATPQAATDPAHVWDEWDNSRLRSRFAAVGGFYAQISGMRHEDFINTLGGNPKVSALIQAFFTQTLLHQPSQLLSSTHPLPGVTLTQFPLVRG